MSKLTRSSYNRMVSGVCGGLAEYFDMDPTLVRVGYVLFGFFTGVVPGLILYFVLSVIMPD
ncbi:MAG: PspC domain-containing protein [Rhodothermales bacterium]